MGCQIWPRLEHLEVTKMAVLPLLQPGGDTKSAPSFQQREGRHREVTPLVAIAAMSVVRNAPSVSLASCGREGGLGARHVTIHSSTQGREESSSSAVRQLAQRHSATPGRFPALAHGLVACLVDPGSRDRAFMEGSCAS